MSFFITHRSARWAVPATAVVLIAGGTLAVSRTASADAGLPARSAAQLLVDVRGAAGTGLSGTVVQTSNLGLPEIPGLSGQGSGSPASTSGGASLTSVVSGTHTWRVWSGGPTQSRVALVSGSGESDVIRNGADVWVWSSAEKSAVHHTLSGAAGQTPTPPSGAATDVPTTPEAAAAKALAAIDPSTAVTTAGTAVVAGRQAYELVLDPRTDATRVAQVRIAVDAEKHVPLRVQVYSTKEANPAVEVGFTSVDFSAPDARQFAFTPPAGTTVTEGQAGAQTSAGAKPAEPKVVGTGWSSVVVATLPAQYATASTQKQVQSLLTSIPKVSGDWGSGRVVDGTLVSAVITDDGRIAVGAVDPAALYAALKAP